MFRERLSWYDVISMTSPVWRHRGDVGMTSPVNELRQPLTPAADPGRAPRLILVKQWYSEHILEELLGTVISRSVKAGFWINYINLFIFI